MSRYEAPAKDPAYTVEVGFNKDSATFWFVVYEGDSIVSMGEPGTLCTLISLIRATWGYVDWNSAQDLAKQLRDDAAWVADARDDAATRFLAAALSA